MNIKPITNINNNPNFTGIYNNKIFKKGLEFAANNGSLFAAGTSLVLSTVARPIAIFATPNTDKDNKKYACAKSLSSSLVGYMLMLVASLPVSRAVKKIDENPEKYLKNSTIENLQKTVKGIEKPLQHSKKYIFATQLFKLGLGLVIAMPKSIFTSNLIPPVMKKIFPDKKDDLLEMKSSKGPSFKGNSELNNLSKGIGRIIDTKFVRKIVDKFYNSNFEMHIMALTDALATGTFVHQVKRNEKIEENRRNTLAYNALISTGLSIVGGYTLDRLLKKPTENFINKFKEINKNSQKLDKYVEGIKVAKPVLILGGIYYLIIPMISTFLADRFDKNKSK